MKRGLRIEFASPFHDLLSRFNSWLWWKK